MQLLAFKYHSLFNSSDKITNFFANPINSTDARLKILFCLTLLQIMSGISYLVGYGWFYFNIKHNNPESKNRRAWTNLVQQNHLQNTNTKTQYKVKIPISNIFIFIERAYDYRFNF